MPNRSVPCWSTASGFLTNMKTPVCLEQPCIITIPIFTPQGWTHPSYSSPVRHLSWLSHYHHCCPPDLQLLWPKSGLAMAEQNRRISPYILQPTLLFPYSVVFVFTRAWYSMTADLFVQSYPADSYFHPIFIWVKWLFSMEKHSFFIHQGHFKSQSAPQLTGHLSFTFAPAYSIHVPSPPILLFQGILKVKNKPMWSIIKAGNQWFLDIEHVSIPLES